MSIAPCRVTADELKAIQDLGLQTLDAVDNVIYYLESRWRERIWPAFQEQRLACSEVLKFDRLFVSDTRRAEACAGKMSRRLTKKIVSLIETANASRAAVIEVGDERLATFHEAALAVERLLQGLAFVRTEYLHPDWCGPRNAGFAPDRFARIEDVGYYRDVMEWVRDLPKPDIKRITAGLRVESTAAIVAATATVDPSAAVPTELYRAGIARESAVATATIATAPGASLGADGPSRADATDWRQVQEKILGLCERGQPCPSRRDLARSLECSPATIQKAINASLRLRRWADASRGTPSLRASGLSSHAVDSLVGREADPADYMPQDEADAILAELKRQVKPEEQAAIDAKTPEEKQQLAKVWMDQRRDSGNRSLGRRA